MYRYIIIIERSRTENINKCKSKTQSLLNISLKNIGKQDGNGNKKGMIK